VEGDALIPYHKPTYSVWYHMKRRCDDASHMTYADYGGRGITYCAEWETYDGFVRSMGFRPEGLSLDRIDNNGPYAPYNCRWVEPIEQYNNRRSNVFVEFNGERLTWAQWGRRLGIDYRQLWARFNVAGWSLEKTLTTPLRVRKPAVRKENHDGRRHERMGEAAP
jgi:hypothetical protein